MYTFNSRVRYSEVDSNARLTLDGIINYMQDCTNFQSEDLGVGLEFHKEKNLAWILNSWQIVIDEYPKMGENITIGTQSFGYEKMFGHRNFLITKEDGSRVAIANSLWVLMDLKKNRPRIVTPEIGDVYGKHKPLEMEYAPRKIKLPEDMIPQEAFAVQKHHLDTNHHVNNCQYICMAEDFLPTDFEIYQMRAEYKMQAKLGDVICPKVKTETDKVVVSLDDMEGKAYAIVEFLKKEGDI